MRQKKWSEQAYNHKMIIIYSAKRERIVCTPRFSIFVKSCQRMISSPHLSSDDLVVWERNWTLLQTFLSQRIFGNIWPSIVRSFMKTSFIKCHWHIRVFWHCYLCERQVCYFHFLSNVQRPWFGILKLQNKFVRILESERWWKYKIMRWGNNVFQGNLHASMAFKILH